MRTVFVLWSGGADSTYLVQRCLADPAYELVFTGYVHVENNGDKAEAKLEAIRRMLPILGTTDKLVWTGVVMRIEFARTNPNLAWKQIPIWLLAAVEAVHFPVDEIAVGYIQGHGRDDAAGYLDEIRALWASYQPFMHRPLPRLVFPIVELPKTEVLAGLDPALRALCVYCEYPVREAEGGAFRPCGRCRICVARHGGDDAPPAAR